MEEHGLPSGILVTQVFSDSPAGRAGLRPFRGLTGDARGDIITAVDDVPVHSVDDMVKYLNDKNAGRRRHALPVQSRGSTHHTGDARPVAGWDMTSSVGY